jgi:hypothetical protein
MSRGFLNNENQLEKSLAPGNPLALFNMETGKRIVFMSEMDMNRKEAFPDRYAFIIRPLEPMEMGQRHLAVLTNDLTDIDGQPLESPAAFAVLRDGIPVTNEEIEAVRDQYEVFRAFLEIRLSAPVLRWPGFHGGQQGLSLGPSCTSGGNAG